MSDNNTSTGIGFLGLLTIVFIILKLVGVIHWSWFWVLAVFTIPATIFVIIILIAMFISSFK